MKIAIVGQGIMGRLLAFSFVNLGCDVTIFTKKESSCSMIAAGLLTPTSELDKANILIHRLGEKSLQIWPQILFKLNANIYFKNNGTVLLAHPHDAQELIRTINIIRDKLPDVSFQKTRFSDKFNDGYYFKNEGQIDAQAVMRALQSHVQQYEVHTEVDHVQPHFVTENNTVHQFDWVCDCRGLGAKSIFNQLRGVRGELIWLKAPNVSLTYPIRMMHPRYNLYVVPRPDDIYIIGASEIESEDHSEISVRSTLELLTATYIVHPGFSEARILHTFTHCRPTLPQHLPEIQYDNGFIAVNGLYRYGFLLAPIIAQEIVEFIVQNKVFSFPQIWKTYHAKNYFE